MALSVHTQLRGLAILYRLTRAVQGRISACSSRLAVGAKTGLYVHGRMQHTHDIDPIGKRQVENHVAPEREAAEARGQFPAFAAHVGLSGKKPALRLQGIEQPVGRTRVIHGDIDPDVFQVLLGLSGFVDAGQGGS